jgi:hypothetical protein
LDGEKNLGCVPLSDFLFHLKPSSH